MIPRQQIWNDGAGADCILVRADADVSLVRRRVRELGAEQGLALAAVEALATAATEMAHNILVHAKAGKMYISRERSATGRGLAVVARDEGPGIGDLTRALEDGYSTAGSLGLGLSSARRLVDEFALESAPGQGTTVTLRTWAR